MLLVKFDSCAYNVLSLGMNTNSCSTEWQCSRHFGSVTNTLP